MQYQLIGKIGKIINQVDVNDVSMKICELEIILIYNTKYSVLVELIKKYTLSCF